MKDHTHPTAIELAFPSRIYQADLGTETELIEELGDCCLALADDDEAGQRWCEENGYPGYTSYASLDDLPWRFPPFETLQAHIHQHAAQFAEALHWDLGDKELVLCSLWVNVLDPGGFHGSHIHPNSVISGTFYVDLPDGASAIKFEDPRLARMMAAPPRKPNAPRDLQTFLKFNPTPGTMFMWESWLRHEVTLNQAEEERITCSFNLSWG
ncbi:MAG: hypothetical protein K9H25_10345 [Rhodospirillum sp.]|nr:hypothetical protein [Rhodospirillum sp.]MCF8490283.1 hypothetical protein [Rhodospirillum sp.]MCF8499346.1 hypothetical protein [Rhodospirillum sp.]